MPLKHSYIPCTFACPHTFVHPLSIQTPPMSPILPCSSVCSREYLHVIWGCRGPSICLDTHHMFGCLPTCQTSPHTSAYLSCFWCLAVHPWDVHYASSCTFLVVHYVSSLYYHGYNYYYYGDCGVFWYVISFIGDHGSLFDGASYNIGSG